MATWVIVDDSDPAISYSGPWTSGSTLTSNDASILDVAFNSTGHVIAAESVNTTDAFASFFYIFTGSQLEVYGATATFNKSIDASDPNLPTWECLVDNIAIPNNFPFGNYPLLSYCQVDNLGPEVHSLEFRITQSGSGIWFDYLRYLPFPNSAPATATAWIGATDTRLRYGEGWVAAGSGFMTDQSVSEAPFSEPTFFMNFSGSSLTWYGLSKAAIEMSDSNWPVLPPISPIVASGYYQVDNGFLWNFTVDLSAQSVAPELNPYSTPLFTTDTAFPGPHNLTVWYEAMDFNLTAWPLTLDFITVDATFAPDLASTTVMGAPSRGKSKTAIIGGAVGGVLGGILLICLGLFITRRWRIHQRRQTRITMAANLARNDIKLRPFTRLVDPDEEKGPGNIHPASVPDA